MTTVPSDRLRWMVINGVVMAMGLTLPIVFHAVGLGNKFLPMLLPILLNGFLSPLGWAVLTGGATPLISAVVTGMPPLYPPVAATMALEGMVLAGVARMMYGRSRKRLWLALVAAVVCGRLTSVALSWAAARLFGLPPGLSAGASLLQSLPGVALQLAVVPLVLRTISRRKGPLFEDAGER
jgi:hypothetical protein